MLGKSASRRVRETHHLGVIGEAVLAISPSHRPQPWDPARRGRVFSYEVSPRKSGARAGPSLAQRPAAPRPAKKSWKHPGVPKKRLAARR